MGTKNIIITNLIQPTSPGQAPLDSEEENWTNNISLFSITVMDKFCGWKSIRGNDILKQIKLVDE